MHLRLTSLIFGDMKGNTMKIDWLLVILALLFIGGGGYFIGYVMLAVIPIYWVAIVLTFLFSFLWGYSCGYFIAPYVITYERARRRR